MTRAIGAAALLLSSTTLAQAGALDRSGQSVAPLFETGNVVELSYGSIRPSVEGTFGGALSSGDVGGDYDQVSLSFKYDLNDRISFAVIVDEPFGADVDYGEADAGYPLAGTEAHFESSGVTALARYRINDAFSVHAGARRVTVDASLFVQSPVVTPLGPVIYTYDGEFEEDSATGFVLGGAFEREDIALRVALTYASELDFSHETTFEGTASGSGDTEYTLPQSVNLEAQTGIAAGTLLFGGIRWAEWTTTEINAFGYAENPVVDYSDDVFTYTLGVGRQFTDSFSGAVSVAYETQQDDLAENLDPTDGRLAFTVGGTYAVGPVDVTGGVTYARLGDATTERLLAEFEDNDAVGVGLSVAYRF